MLLVECFVQRIMEPILHWERIFESSIITGDKSLGRAKVREWPPAVVGYWATVTRDLWLESVRFGLSLTFSCDLRQLTFNLSETDL